MPAPKLTKEQRAGLKVELQVAAERAEPVDVVEIARRYKLAPASLRGIASRMGVPIAWRDGTLIQRIMLVAHATKTIAEIAAEIGAKPEEVSRAIRHARSHAVIVPYRNRLAKSVQAQLALKPLKLPREVEQWFLDQLPSEGEFVDLLRAIIIDAYYDEVDD